MNKNIAGIAAAFLLCASVVSPACQAQDQDARRAVDGTPVRLVAKEPGLAIDAENRLLLAIPIANEGGRTATKVSVTAVALGASPKLAPRALPVVLGDIAPRHDTRFEAAFAVDRLKSGSHQVVVIKGSYLDGRTRGNFAVRQHVTIPLRSGESAPLRSLSIKSQDGKGNPEAVRPAMEEHANEDVGPPIPTRRRGSMKPSAPETKVVPGPVDMPRSSGLTGLLIREAQAGDDPFLFFVSTQAVLTNGGAFPDATGASSDKVVLYASNAGLRFSTDGGLHFSGSLGLPGDVSVDGGPNGDNIVVYIPKIDRFVWFHQFRHKTNGPNRYRVSVASPTQVADSNGQAWMYFDLTSGLFGFGNDWMDYPDVAVGNKFLHFNANVVGVHSGRMVGRIPLEDLKNGGTIHIGYTDAPLQMAWGSHLAQNITDTAYVSGHNGNDTVRVYVFPESANGYTVHDVAGIDLWPDDPANYTSRAPNEKQWLNTATLPGFAIIGAALKPSLCVDGKPTAGKELWLAWTAAKGDGFPQPHVQLVRINAANYKKLGQAQIWNPSLAFAYPALTVNKRNEVGVAVGLGGKDSHSTFGVSIYGEPYIYLPPVSPDASIDRYGDYFAVRRHAPNESVFSGFGLYYTLNNKKNPVCGAGADACNSNLSYIQFGRKSALTGASVPETCPTN
jgi:hypothetical protein